jgi:hypothetical protein
MESAKRDDIRGVGGIMTYAELENAIMLADRMIASNSLAKAEYGRGYQSGIKEYYDNGQQESFIDHYFIAEIARRNHSRDVHAFVRGYSDGAKGLELDMNVSFHYR